ncbi:hypothetical protein ACVIHI_008088 [Bradyrhizobium sp. USDA 4524]|nr:hypothetical protein [Bradyrhizobium sp. USDA 4538]MCP1899561.1 hypothetical protein [Bradyrhizobium sp. USDA 4537]MCP1986330.1 hypothetical protein [Bradyrhizobium sp. USDA 4539]
MDGYAAYNKLARSDRGNDGITLAGCWSHCRRKFYELHVAGSSEGATATVERMAKLWQIEKTVRGQSPDARVAARQQASAAIVADLFDLWQQTLRRISGKSKLAEAIRYAVSRRAIFERFLTDGRIELDSNIVERAIRPQTITRKNSLFAGSDVGASYCSSGDALIKEGDSVADLEISDDAIVWHRLRGTQRLAAGRRAG